MYLNGGMSHTICMPTWTAVSSAVVSSALLAIDAGATALERHTFKRRRHFETASILGGSFFFLTADADERKLEKGHFFRSSPRVLAKRKGKVGTKWWQVAPKRRLGK